MQVFNIQLHFQGFREMADLQQERLQDLLWEQTYLPLYELPDQPPARSSLQLDIRQLEIFLSCTVKASRRMEAHLRLSALAEMLQATLSKELDEPDLAVGGFVSLDSVKMLLDLVLEGPGGFYAVYRAGGVYALGDGVPSMGLQDPLSPLFEPGGLRKLDARETWQLLNSDAYQTVWARSKALLKGSPEIGLVDFKPASAPERKQPQRAA